MELQAANEELSKMIDEKTEVIIELRNEINEFKADMQKTEKKEKQNEAKLDLLMEIFSKLKTESED